MSGNLVKKGQVGALQTLENFLSQTGLENVKTSINTKTAQLVLQVQRTVINIQQL